MVYLITVLGYILTFLFAKKRHARNGSIYHCLVLIIGLSFIIEIIFGKTCILAELAKGFIPTALNNEALYIAVGIIGATVMPHNLYLHSALVQTRKIRNNEHGIKKAIKYNLIDSTIALNAAFFVNAGILILAASVFFYQDIHLLQKLKTHIVCYTYAWKHLRQFYLLLR